MNRLFTAGSVGAVQAMVAMLLLCAVMALQAGVQLPMAAPINKRHRAGRHGGRGRSCSTTAPQNALAEQRQLAAAACSPRSSVAHSFWMESRIGGCAMPPLVC